MLGTFGQGLSLKRNYIKAQRFITKFLGRRVFFWLMLTSAGGFLAAALEVSLAGFLQVFLITLGVSMPRDGLSGYLQDINLSLESACFVLVGIGILRFCAQVVTGQGTVAVQEAMMQRLRTFAIYDILLEPSNEYVPASSTNFRISEVFPKAAKWIAVFFSMTVKAVETATLLISMVLLAWREAAVSLVGLFLVAILSIRMTRVIRNSSHLVTSELQGMSKSIEKVTRNWFLIKLLRTERMEFFGLDSAIKKYSGYTVRSTFYAGAISSFVQFLGIIVIVVVLLTSKNVFQSPGSMFIPFLYLLLRFTQGLSQLSASYGVLVFLWPGFLKAYTYVLERSDGAIAEIDSLTERAEFFGSHRSDNAPNGSLESARRQEVREDGSSHDAPEIQIKNLNFKYLQDVEIGSLKNLSIDVQRGAQFGIIGPSGCGKSTLLALILGFLKAGQGEILIDKQPVNEFFKPGPRRRRIGYVGAEPFLFGGSVYDNINYGANPPFSEADCWRALSEAQLSEDAKNLPGGLSYEITENGMGLSAGQKQRLALARALIGRPELLILDEASANLDQVSEQKIAEVLNSLDYGCTRIIVSHRPGLIQYCDRVLNLGNPA